MESSIKGRLIRPASEVTYGFILAPELWGLDLSGVSAVCR